MKTVLKILKITGITLVSIVFASILFISIHSKIGNSIVTAEIEGLGTKIVAVSSNSYNWKNYKTKFAISINGKIRCKIKIDDLSRVSMVALWKMDHFRSKRIGLFIKPDEEVKIKGKLDDLSVNYEIVQGNKYSKQVNELKKVLLPLYEEETRLWRKSKELRKNDPELSRKYQKKFDSIRFYVVAPKRTEFAKAHLNYELIPTYFLESHIPQDTVIKYYNLCPEYVKTSPYGKIVGATIKGWELTKIGNLAPNFSQTTLGGELFQLKDHKGKYIVLDFWASWCAPCMYGMPRMKEYHTKYQNHIEFVGISDDEKKSDWEKAINKKEANWIQIHDSKGESPIFLLYAVQSYPTKFIINREGIIIHKFNGEKDNFYNALDSIMNSNNVATSHE